MPTKNPRYSVSFSNDTVYAFLKMRSKEKRISVSKAISDLVEEAMELQEDMELSKLADEAWERNKDGPWFSHEEVMKRCGLE
jgi:hypothetical protein